MITPKNLVMHELIGLEAKIADSKNKSSVGARGKVTDETRNTLTLEIKKYGKAVEKNFIKDQCMFSFRITDQKGKEVWVRIDGKLLVSRPEDRIKKKFKKW